MDNITFCKYTYSYLSESHRTKSPDQKLVHEVDSFNKRFMDCEKELMTRLQEHLPRDKMGLRHIVEQQKVSFMFIISRSYVYRNIFSNL